jgi:hypothetical protein
MRSVLFVMVLVVRLSSVGRKILFARWLK